MAETAQPLTLLGVECPHTGDDLGLREWHGQIGEARVLANWNRTRGYQLTVHAPGGLCCCAFGDDFETAARLLTAEVRRLRAALALLDCGDDLDASGLLGVGAR